MFFFKIWIHAAGRTLDHIIDPSGKCLPVFFSYKVINLLEGTNISRWFELLSFFLFIWCVYNGSVKISVIK